MKALSRTRRFPPLNALRAFEAAARHLNFRLAADELGVTQGAVAQQVRHLEDVVEIQLFRRLPRGLALTREGLEYFSSVQRALQIIADATDALGQRPMVLAVSTTPSFASKWLIPRLSDFGRLHPDIEVRVIADERLASFRADGVDIAIRLGKPPFPAGLVAQLLFPLDIFAVASPTLLDSGPPIRTPADLSKHALLHDAHDLWPEFIEKLGGTGQTDPTKGPRFSQSLLAIDAAVAGQGIALTSEPLVERDIAEGRLRRVFDFSFPMSLGFYVVFPQANAHSEALEAMRRWLFAQYGGA
ncbi:LysR family transcriptional regulator [Burkholderia sp. MSMB0856]|uniref:transcriptional regulator GcvA n=1 Tax=Burkholderia TaxID=32008 RepID=UPI0007569EA6|nr:MULTISPECIES: transcriptional regulator GcvA [Burkholderia]AOJ89721.1 LysR family transcriptional regulator [Burkholderia sp. MSMB0856]KUY74211.1 LysR family transcriptional regulator [Burkholderia sp. RF4-BP95]KVH34582.1 LysR family transcriptional regulator [Burkholderia sp. MSMB0856]CAG9260303.1 Glycine cleavage system transcriptional activator [Burkholderia diffusa]